MDYYLESSLLLTSEALPVLTGFVKVRKFDTSLKIFYLVCITTLITELLALIAAQRVEKNNMLVYNIAAIIIQVMICMYFYYSVDFLKKKKIGLWLCVASIIVWIVAVQIGGSIKDMDSLFLYFQYVVIITLAIISINSSHKSDSAYSHSQSIHFWISLLMIFSCCLFFVQWGIYKWLLDNRPLISTIINDYFTIASCLLNMGFGLILLFFKSRNRVS